MNDEEEKQDEARREQERQEQERRELDDSKRRVNLYLSIGMVIALLIIFFPMLKGCGKLTGHVISESAAYRTDDQMIAYLKKNESKINAKVIKEYPEINSIKWEWDTLDQDKYSSGNPWVGENDTRTVDVRGTFNNIKDSDVWITFTYGIDEAYPEMSDLWLEDNPYYGSGENRIELKKAGSSSEDEY